MHALAVAGAFRFGSGTDEGPSGAHDGNSGVRSPGRAPEIILDLKRAGGVGPAMGTTGRFRLGDRQREILERWSRGGSTPYRLVVRSRIVLMAARGFSNRRIARRLRINPITVSRWKARFRLLGPDGLRREAPRLGSPPRIPGETVRRIVERTLYDRPRNGGTWSTRTLARAVGVSHSTVRRVWKSHDIRPPRSPSAVLARDLRYRPLAIDVVGLYVNPPQRALALGVRDAPRGNLESVRRPSRASPSVRVRSGASGVPHLLSTLTLLDTGGALGTAVRHQDQEFLSFLHIVRERRQGRERIVLLADSEPPATSVPLARWVRRHPEFTAHLPEEETPLREVVAEWLQSGAFRRPPSGSLESLPGLRAAVERWVRDSRSEPGPFAWTRGEPREPERGGP